MVNIQDWVNQKYPTKEEKAKVSELYLNEPNLEGELDLKEFIYKNPYNNTIGCQVFISHFLDKTKIVLKNKPEVLKTFKLRNAQGTFDQDFFLDDTCSGKVAKHKKYQKKSNITEVDFSHKGLEGSLIIQDFPELGEINPWANKLTTLEFINCPQLWKIYSSNNNLSQLPSGLDPKVLKILDISDNNISLTDLSVFSQLVNLKGLWIGNSQRRIKQGIHNRFTGSLKPLRSLDRLKQLDIANTNITTGSEYLPESLEEFRCANNGFTKLDLSNCPNLTSLDCSNNPLTSLQLYNGGERITRLGLSANHLKDLTMFSQLINLEELDLRDFSVNSSLEPLKNFKKLRKLNICGNTKVLPQWEFLHRIKEITFADEEKDLKENEQIKAHRQELIPYHQKRKEKDNYKGEVEVIYYNILIFENYCKVRIFSLMSKPILLKAIVKPWLNSYSKLV